MNKILYSFVIFFMVFSCSDDQDKIIRQIRQLEWNRTIKMSEFKNYLTAEDVEIRLTATDAMAKTGSEEYLPLLRSCLSDPEQQVVQKAIFALGQIGQQDSILLALLSQSRFVSYQADIISALGKPEETRILPSLFNQLSELSDSLKAMMIKRLTIIAPHKYKTRQHIQLISGYLYHSNESVRAAAAYFFSRHPQALAVHRLIRMPLTPHSIADKYRLKGISRALSKYYIQRSDSALIDTLRTRMLTDLNNPDLCWQEKLYEIDILSSIGDSLSLMAISSYLSDNNPHLRARAISALSPSDSLVVRKLLLQRYPDASWADKGRIILALADKNPEMVYSLIQQNLDQGNIYFKQLLLKSLAKIRGRLSIQQLRQFLNVPNPRLNHTAFQELWRMSYIGYDQAQKLLLSGDPCLSSIAVAWIIDHPEWAEFEDLKSAYQMYDEAADAELMVTLAKAISKTNNRQAEKFLTNVYDSTSSYILAQEIYQILKNNDQNPAERTDLQPHLFVPDTVYFQKEPIEAIIETEKGDIIIQLRPDVAPSTVANFIYLVKNGFYKGLTFHRVVSDFVIQGGDPRGDGWGGPGYSIPCEYNQESFRRGTVGMATAGKDTGGSQFFICHSEQPHLNGRYTVFAQVIKGMNVVDLIEINDKIIEIRIQH